MYLACRTVAQMGDDTYEDYGNTINFPNWAEITGSLTIVNGTNSYLDVEKLAEVYGVQQ